MRQRFSSHTTLIELTVALLCFLLASVIILGLFTGADAVSRHSAKLREATIWAQECAELIAGGEDALQTLIAAGYIAADIRDGPRRESHPTVPYEGLLQNTSVAPPEWTGR